MEKSALKTKSSDLIITSTNVWKSFETGDNYTTVLKDIALSIKKGEFVVLFGPSGCGKSTLLNTLMGLEHPDKGDIKFKGMEIWNLNSDDRAVIRKSDIGIVYQQQNWLKSLNVLENVAVIGSLLGVDKHKAEDIAMEKLKLVGMTHRAKYKPYELSSGEQQRISLARALMSDPSLIIADEPTGNLDVKSGLIIMNILKDLSKAGKTILTVTHNPEHFEFADRILFMIDGRIRKNINVTKDNIDEIKKGAVEEIEKFVEGTEKGEIEEKEKAPKPVPYVEEPSKGKDKIKHALDSLKFLAVYTLSMLLLLLLYIPAYILDKIFLKKGKLSSRARDFIIKIFNVSEGRKQGIVASINSWELGEISLSYLMEKKSRTIITVLGIGVGIGFITFLLSIGYGLEGLVIDEIAEIEEMRQVTVNPVVGSKVVLDEENYEIISNIDGVKDVHPLINVATTVYYKDSQTDIVAYGVNSNYLDVTKEIFLAGGNFDQTEQEIVVDSNLLELLGLDTQDIIGEKFSLEFIPVDQEIDIVKAEEESSLEKVRGTYDDRVEYTIAGVVDNGDSPVIFFPIDDAKKYGIENYSEVLVSLTDNSDMVAVRKEIETLGMETTSVMDTVAQVENLFKYLRIGLAGLGIIAFLIAVLGMINTLTVSLMERTREVGLLKSIGMRSNEVEKLFITESLLIAFFGGVSGILLGYLFGVGVSLIISVISVSRGGEYLAISKMPIYLIVGVIFVSVLIGFLTGLYPSKRAVKMSPLDALRYE
jgi:ABC-type lipoprotein export system ATPase subunit/ABC-type antimicrobial peptide transport system permease subunit